MRLSQLFSGEVRTDSSNVRTQPSPAQIEQLNRQIRSLVPGQTINGEIVSRNGGEVQIRLSEDMVLNARIDRSLNIEIGKNMTFEVKNNGSSLTLSPLFTNVATDVNVLKALDMAGLPVNRTSVSMTEQLMKAGLPVNKNMLQQIYREINSFPQGEISDVINLHKLQLPVNEANLNQMAAYRNLSHQLLDGMDTILEALPEVFDSLIAEGEISGAVKLYQEVLQLFQGNDGVGQEVLQLFQGNDGAGQEVLQLFQGNEGAGQAVPSEENAADRMNLLPGNLGEPPEKDITGATETAGRAPAAEELTAQAPRETGAMGESLRAAVTKEVLDLLDNLSQSGQNVSVMREQVLQFAQGQSDVQQFFSVLSSMADTAKFSAESMKALEKMFSGRDFRELITGALKDNWMIKPEELAVPGKVEELYRRLDRQMKGLTGALEEAGQGGTTAFKAVSAMSQNIDFLQQVNQMYAYVQLPLRLQQGEAHGELYVYTNRKNLARSDGTVSALLHLDMEHLGPVDVYVAMRESRVNTQFYLRDEEMIDFIGAHMDILTQRLKKRGYDCNFAMTVKKDAAGESTAGGLEPILRQEKGIALSHYAFDVRT